MAERVTSREIVRRDHTVEVEAAVQNHHIPQDLKVHQDQTEEGVESTDQADIEIEREVIVDLKVQEAQVIEKVEISLSEKIQDLLLDL